MASRLYALRKDLEGLGKKTFDIESMLKGAVQVMVESITSNIMSDLGGVKKLIAEVNEELSGLSRQLMALSLQIDISPLSVLPEKENKDGSH